jgi:hypothetical protein
LRADAALSLAHLRCGQHAASTARHRAHPDRSATTSSDTCCPGHADDSTNHRSTDSYTAAGGNADRDLSPGTVPHIRTWADQYADDSSFRPTCSNVNANPNRSNPTYSR